MTSPDYDVPAAVRRPRAPAEEVAGPALTDLVAEFRRANDGMAQLLQRAKMEAIERCYHGRTQFGTDSNGDGCASLFAVPQGATGYLMMLAIDQDGVTPAAPNTAPTLWHAIYDGSQPDITDPTKIIKVGSLLDCSPLSPAADAQLPYVYTYGDRYGAPTLVGPGVFYFVVDGATASKQHALRYNVVIAQPEP